jgi:hypothetical protein
MASDSRYRDMVLLQTQPSVVGTLRMP